MPRIQYAFRDDEKTITMLTQGSTAACPLCQIVTVRNREISPDFLDNYMALDIKGPNFPVSALSNYGRSIVTTQDNRRYYAIIDSQIEFTVKPRTMQKLEEFLPAYTGIGLYNYFEGQTYGYLIVLKVFVSDKYIPDELMEKGRMGSAQIISLYDKHGEKIQFDIPSMSPLIDDGYFENIKFEILHTLRLENALIGIYGTDDNSKKLLKQKRDDYNDNFGQSKHTYNEDDDVDRAQVDYEAAYARIIQIAPSLSSFIDYVRNIKPPQMVEWQTLFPKVRDGDEGARHRIIEMYLRNVVRIALSFAEKYQVPIDDAIQDGVMGLMAAIDKFNDSANEMFQQYYAFWVRRAIQREMSKYLYERYFPAHLHEKLIEIREIIFQYGIDLPYDYALLDKDFINAISEKSGITFEETKRYIEYLAPTESLENIIENTNKEYDVMAIEDEELLIEHLHNENLQVIVEQVLHTLPPKEERIMRMRCGFIDGCPKTLEEIGKEFGLSRERIRQLETKAIDRLRHHSRSRKLRWYYE